MAKTKIAMPHLLYEMGTAFYGSSKPLGPCLFIVNFTLVLVASAIIAIFTSLLTTLIGGHIRMGVSYNFDTDPSYLASFGCGIAAFLALALLGFVLKKICGRFEIIDRSEPAKK
jgi:hypothetical protein